MRHLAIMLMALALCLPAQARQTIRQILPVLEQRYEINFVYDSTLDIDIPCGAEPQQGQTLDAAMHSVFDGTGITWTVSGRYVAIRKAPVRKFSVRGHITDAASSETLIGAAVMTGTTGTVSNEFGFYTITLPEGDYTLTCSYIGYNDKTVKVRLHADTVIDMALRGSEVLEAASVTSYAESGINATRAGAIELPQNIIRNTPVLLGEPDVLKTVQMLPGVQGGLDGFSGIFVRGGSDDENLLLLDGVPLYNASHMFGVFSTFAPEAVKKVTLYKSSFPARYGGRVSSVLDVRTNDGDMHDTHGTVSVGLLSDRLHIEGPLADGRTSYSLSGRMLHSFIFAPVLKAFDVPVNFWFYDFNGKVNHIFSDRDRLYAGIYHGRDFMRSDDNGKWEQVGRPDGTSYLYRNGYHLNMHWGNTMGSLRWNHIFGERLFANTTLSVNSYKAGKNTLDQDFNKVDGKMSTQSLESEFKCSILDISAAFDLEWHPSPAHAVRTGGALTMHDYSPESSYTGFRVKDTTNPARDTTSKAGGASSIDGYELSLYGEDDMSIGDRLRVNAGLHIAVFGTSGKTYFSPQPRLSVRYAITDDIAAKVGYSRMAQYIHRLSSGTVGMPTDYWVPITRHIKPVTSDQVSAGLTYTGLNGWEMSVDGYYKKTDNVLEFKDAAVTSAGSADWDRNVSMGEGRSYGVELLARKTKGATTGWVSYTWSKTDRIFRDGSINDGRWFPYMYDRRHVATVCANHHFGKQVDMSAVWTLASGAAMTLPTRTTYVVGTDGHMYAAPYAASKGNWRLPASHRLDLSCNFTKVKPRGERTWSIGVYNVYARRNPNFIDIDIRDGSQGTGGVRLKKFSYLVCIPSISYTYRF